MSDIFAEKYLKIPTKSAFSQFRSRISFRFFRDALKNLIRQIDSSRLTFRGYQIFAIDGFEVVLPRTKDILNSGFVGRSVGLYRETYYPRMYLSHCYDVLSKTTKDIEVSVSCQELKLALEIIPRLGQKTITLYDRLYLSKTLIEAHFKAKNHFIARVRGSALAEIVTALAGQKKRSKKKIAIGSIDLWVIKIWNPSSKQWALFVSNLPEYWITEKTISRLYGLRWEVETSFKEWVDTLKLEQWHSKSINGILQELYASLWLYNYAKLQILQNTAKTSIKPLEIEYSKPNFKLIFDYIVSQIKLIIRRKAKDLGQKLAVLQKLSLEKRKRRSRTYPRQLRCSPSPFTYNNQVWDPRISGALN